MRPKLYDAVVLRKLFRREKVTDLNDMKVALGSESHMTIFRKLKELGYRTSYSHRGMFYTLENIPQFNQHGLWSHHDIWFSEHGTLLETADILVTRSESGYFSRELDELLHVGTKRSLRKLVDEKRLFRKQISGRFLYCSKAREERERQLAMREQQEAQIFREDGQATAKLSPKELRTAMRVAYSALDEKQRRLLGGLDSLRLGHGGDKKVAEIIGIDVRTVARGRREVLEGDFDPQRVRKPGGGRKKKPQRSWR